MSMCKECDELKRRLDWILHSPSEGSLPFYRHQANKYLLKACEYGNELQKTTKLLEEMSNVLGRTMAYIHCDNCTTIGPCETCDGFRQRCNEVLGKVRLGVTGVKEDGE